MKILLDMNLSPAWCQVLARHGHESVHWSAIGDPRAADSAIMGWACREGYVVVTHDLDFGAILATTRGTGPSVIQVRAQDILPIAMETLLVNALAKYRAELQTGALIVIDRAKLRVRILPLGR